MNTITRQFLICSAIAVLGLLGGGALAQNAPAPATPPAAPAAPEPAPAAAQSNATPPAATGEATANDDANGPRPADDTSDADPPIVWTRDRARGWGGARFQENNEIVTLGGDSNLPAGASSNAVVSIFGSSTSAGDVQDAVVSVLGDTRVEGGRVGDAAVAVLGSLYVNAEVNGDVVATLGDVELGPNANVRGNVVVVGGQLTRDPAAQVHGGVQNVWRIPRDATVGFKVWVKNCLRYLRPLAFSDGLGWAWTLALGVLALYALFPVLFRDPFDRCVQTLQARPGQTIVASVLAMLLSPIVYVVLGITIIGIAFMPIAGFVMFLATLFGKAVVLAWIGRGVLKAANQNEGTHTAIAVLIGGAIVLLLYVVPVLGFLVFNLIGILGFGAVVYTVMLSSQAKRAARPPASGPGAGARAPGAGPTPAPAGSAAGAGSVNLDGTPPSAAPYTAGFGAEGTAGRNGFGASSGGAGAAASAAASGGADASFVASGGSVQEAGTGAPGGGGFAGGGGGQDGFTGGDFTGAGGNGGGAGTPPPSNGTVDALSLPRAGFWIRILALLIDTIIVGVVFQAIDHHTKLQLVALAAYGAIMWKLKGTTVGGIVCNLKIVRLDGRELDWSTAIVRALGCFLSLIVCGLGFIWIAFDPGRQAWHDKIAGTAVVRVPQGVSLL